MNHIYKVIWNKAKHCYTVVSEIAKNHSTSSVSKKSASAVLLAVTVLLSGGVSVYADNLAPTITKIEIGQDATATGQNGVAIGSRTEASGLDSIAIGGNTKATGSDSIAIGDDTTASSRYSVAIGDDIHFTGESATAVGQQAHATGNVSTAIGTMTNVDADYNRTHDDWRKAGEQSTAIGAYAGSWGLASTAVGGFSKAEGKLATAVGYNSKANVDYGTALGDYSEVKAGKGAAIGASSVADREAGVVGAFAPEGADSLTWKANAGAVSVGSETITRQITNVAAGSEATDAVNVAQLKAATENAGWNLSTGKEITNPTKVKSGAIVDFSGDDENITVSKEETDFATLVNVKLNRNLNVDSVNAGDYFMSAEKGIGFGGEAYITQSGLNANDKVITNVAAGVADTDAVNVSQLKNSAWKLAANGVLTEAEDVKAGDYVDFNGDQNVSVSKDAKDGVKTVKVELNKNLKDIESISNGDAKMTLNGAAGTAGMINGKGASIYMQDGYTVINSKVAFDQNGKISGVAAGVADTDAVNVSQLKAVGATANMGWNLATNGVATEATNVKPGDYVDFSGDKNISVSHDGTKVQVKLNENIDVNSVQTNALNSKYNLSVGTMAENGIMPFFVNSTGAFYAAHNKFSVDKDGNVNANSVQTNALNSKYNLSVGTMAENGIMPFFVNSTGAFYAANNNFSVDKDGGVTATSGNIGNVTLNNGVFYKNSALRDGELYVGDNKGNHSQITSTNAKLGKVMIDDTGRISGVAAGRIAADSTDAINGSQLHAVQQEAGKHTKVVNGSNITVEETDQDGQKTYKVGLNKDLLLGDITGKNVSISGTNGTIETTGSIATKDKIYADKGAKLADVNVTGDTISNDKSSVKLDKDGTVTINNKVTVDQSGKISGVAAGDISDTSTDAVNGSQLKATNDRVSQVEGDITNIKSDITDIKGDVKNLGDRVTKVEQEAGKHTKVVNGSNVTVEETDQDGQKTYKVGLNKDLLLGDITGKNVSISGTNGTIETTGSIATKDKIYADKGAKLADVNVTGDTISNDKSSVKLDKDGTVTINNKVTVDQNGKVSGVAAGVISEKSTDAVNGSQLFATNQQVVQNAQSISKLGNRINKVGAGAAALAALHPLDFDPDDKWDIAAGYGNYNGENAAAIGAYYRPNEDTMFSVGGSFGNGENMVNAGVSLKLGQGNHVSTSKVAMAKEIKDLRKELEGLKSALLDVNAGKKLDTSKLQLFPDVPKNHWAYEYVSTLKGNGVLTGYPDGEFKGDRPMTRYEFATMLYKAMLEGATLSDKILKEFAPELERFTVDTVHQDKDGKPTVERVRTVKAEK